MMKEEKLKKAIKEEMEQYNLDDDVSSKFKIDGKTYYLFEKTKYGEHQDKLLEGMKNLIVRTIKGEFD